MAFFTVGFMADLVNLSGFDPLGFGTIWREGAALQQGFPQRGVLPGHPW
jgi:hypothetical protein